jgi:hypothetical protein
MPEIVEILRDFRNLQSLLAHHHALRAAARAPNPPLSLMHKKEKNWEAIGEIEDRLAKRIERLKCYLKDSQAEVWNKVFPPPPLPLPLPLPFLFLYVCVT